MTHESPHAIARRSVERMLRDDAFTRWLAATVVSLEPGSCTLEMTVRQEMLNGFSVCHGGVLFALADSALAFASNGHGRVALGIDHSFAIPVSAREGDILRAKAQEIHRGERVAHYQVTVTRSNGDIVGLLKGTVYITSRPVGE